MPKKTDYHTRTDMNNEAKLRDGLKTLPDFARSFFYSIETTMAVPPSTRNFTSFPAKGNP